LSLAVLTSYTDSTDRTWVSPGLCAATYWSENGVSGAGITNAKGELVGWHVTSGGAPGTPAYFQPVTDEIMKILAEPPKPLNLGAGLGTTRLSSVSTSISTKNPGQAQTPTV